MLCFGLIKEFISLPDLMVKGRRRACFIKSYELEVWNIHGLVSINVGEL